VLPGIIGSMQAMEAIKYLLNIGSPLNGKLIIYDALETTFRNFQLRKDPDCKTCSRSPEEITLKSNTPTPDPMMKEITVQELKQRIEADDIPQFIDVRTPQESTLASLGGELLPLQEFASLYEKLDPQKETVIYCKAGARSARACMFLVDQGFTNVTNVIGGTDAWRSEIDPSLPYA